jgi:hypothetical protein
MAKRIKAHQFEVDNSEAAMAKFKAGLAKLVQVPKSEIKAKRKRVKKPKA